jgi:hypothetical protein
MHLSAVDRIRTVVARYADHEDQADHNVAVAWRLLAVQAPQDAAQVGVLDPTTYVP